MRWNDCSIVKTQARSTTTDSCYCPRGIHCHSTQFLTHILVQLRITGREEERWPGGGIMYKASAGLPVAPVVLLTVKQPPLVCVYPVVPPVQTVELSDSLAESLHDRVLHSYMAGGDSIYTVPLWVLVVSITTFAVCFVFMTRRLLPLPPGPPSWPILGSALVIPKQREWLTYESWSLKFGAYDHPGSILHERPSCFQHRL